MRPNIEVETIVQLGPMCKNPMFRYCLMVVTEVKSWGIQGYVQSLGENGQPGGQAYYRATWGEFEVCQSSKPVWITE